jgi:hypothetical protein
MRFYTLIIIFFDKSVVHKGLENLLIFDILPGVIACPNTLTFVLPTSVTV